MKIGTGIKPIAATCFLFLLAAVVFAAPIPPQLVLVNTGEYMMKDNGHHEAHHKFFFTKRPKNNDFRAYDPMGKGTWHVRLQILERPSNEKFNFSVFLDDGKAWGHRNLVKFPVNVTSGTWKKHRQGYREWPKATPIDWEYPLGTVRILVSTGDPTASIAKCEYDGKCWNFTYDRPNADKIWPYKIWMTVTLVAPGGVYDDTGHPGGKPTSGITIRPISGERLESSTASRVFDIQGRFLGFTSGTARQFSNKGNGVVITVGKQGVKKALARFPWVKP